MNRLIQNQIDGKLVELQTNKVFEERKEEIRHREEPEQKEISSLQIFNKKV